MAKVSSQVIGTVKKYQNSVAIKKHNAIVRAWAAPCARDVAAVFWSTWKDIENRIPTSADGDFREADREMTAAEKRALKNKYTAATRAAVNAASPVLNSVLEYYTYKAFVAGFVEQSRNIGFMSPLMCESSEVPSESSSVSESEIVFFGTSPNGYHDIGCYTDDNGKVSYVARSKSRDSYYKYTPSGGVGNPINLSGEPRVSFTGDYQGNIVRLKKDGGSLPSQAKTYLKSISDKAIGGDSAVKTEPSSSSRLDIYTSASFNGWVSVPNYRAQRYAKQHAAQAVTQINSTTRKEIASIVQQGVENGTSYGDIAKAINAKFKDFAVPQPQKHIANRGVLVAVTELANAYCQANYEVGEMLQRSGVKMMKAWQTLEDDRVSDGCRHNGDAGWIELSEPFPSGDQTPPRFPGCRCDFLQEMLNENYIGRSIDDYYNMSDLENEASNQRKSDSIYEVKQKTAAKNRRAVKKRVASEGSSAGKADISSLLPKKVIDFISDRELTDDEKEKYGIRRDFAGNARKFSKRIEELNGQFFKVFGTKPNLTLHADLKFGVMGSCSTYAQQPSIRMADFTGATPYGNQRNLFHPRVSMNHIIETNLDHEYGHFVQGQMNKAIVSGRYSNELVSNYGRDYSSAVNYDDIEEMMRDDIMTEVRRIDPEASRVSKYGDKNNREFFAECFADMLGGTPSAFGKGLETYLRNVGVIS